jgi:hypothetical protein
MRPSLGSHRHSQPWRRGGIGIWTAMSLVLAGAFFYSAWLTSIVDCAVNGSRPLLIASAMFFPVGIVHGIAVWFGG